MKKILVVLLALALVMSFAVLASAAGDPDETWTIGNSNDTAKGPYYVGDDIKIEIKLSQAMADDGYTLSKVEPNTNTAAATVSTSAISISNAVKGTYTFTATLTKAGAAADKLVQYNVNVADYLTGLKVADSASATNLLDFKRTTTIYNLKLGLGQENLYIKPALAQGYSYAIALNNGDAGDKMTATKTVALNPGKSAEVTKIQVLIYRGEEADAIDTYTVNIDYVKAALSASGFTAYPDADKTARTEFIDATDKTVGTKTYDYYFEMPYNYNEAALFLNVAEAFANIDVKVALYEGRFESASEVTGKAIDSYNTSDKRKKYLVIPDDTTGNSAYTIMLSATGYDSVVYTMNVYNWGANTWDSSLKNLVFSKSSSSFADAYQLLSMPTFAKDTYEYRVYVPKDTSLYLYPTLSDSGADIYIDDTKLTGSTLKSTNKSGSSTVKVEVVAEDGYNTTEYTIDVNSTTRTDATATLDGIELYKGSKNTSNLIAISPKFAKATLAYTAAVAEDEESVRIYPAKDNANQIVYVNDELLTGSYKTVDLAKGANSVKITVIAANYEDSKEYNLTVYRGEVLASLKSLSVYAGTSKVTLSPAFADGIYNYIGRVGSATTSVVVYPTTTIDGSTIKIYKGSATTGTSMDKGKANTVALTPGVNEFKIEVTSPAGVKENYSLSIYREKTDPAIKANSTQKISINGGTPTLISSFNIGDNNFVKLRDLAALLTKTTKKFNVVWNSEYKKVEITPGVSYTKIAGDLVVPTSYKKAVVSPQSDSIYMNGKLIAPMAYNIDNNNYFLLRDLAVILDFHIQWDSANKCVNIDTTKGFDPAANLSTK